MMRLLRWWWRRPARSPYAVRVLLAAVLGTIGAIGIAGPSFGQSTPSGVASAPTKYPINPGPGDLATGFPSSPSLISEGRTLYSNGCSACHGLALQGRPGIAPSLKGIGAGPIDFYVSTGRMPLDNPLQEPQRNLVGYTRHQIYALIAFISKAGGGPPAPHADPAKGSLSVGLHQFTLHCAGCHQLVARGGLTIGAWIPNLQNADALQIAEAIRMGPFLMPHFDPKQINQYDLDSIVRYVLWTRHPSNIGGWGIYNIGPIPEGMATFFIALLAMVIVARLIGERMETE